MGQVLTNLSDLLDLGNDAGGEDIDNVGTITAAAFVGDASGLTGIATDAAITTVAQALVVHAARTDNPHSVTKSQIGLGSVSDALQLIAANNLSDVVNAATARTNLGLGTAATQATSAFEAAITAGTNLQYWRGDKSWQTLNAAAIPDFATAVAAYAPSSPTPTLVSVLAAGNTDGGAGATFTGAVSAAGLTSTGNQPVTANEFVGAYHSSTGFELGANAPGLWFRGDHKIRWGNTTTGPYYGGTVDLVARRSGTSVLTVDSDSSGGAADLTVTGIINASGYKVGGVSGVTGTFAVPTSVTISGGIVTAIS